MEGNIFMQFLQSHPILMQMFERITDPKVWVNDILKPLIPMLILSAIICVFAKLNEKIKFYNSTQNQDYYNHLEMQRQQEEMTRQMTEQQELLRQAELQAMQWTENEAIRQSDTTNMDNMGGMGMF